MKRILIVIMAALLMFNGGMIACAADEDYGVMPCWDYTNNVILSLSYSDRIGTVDISIVGYPSATNIEYTGRLYRYNTRTGWEELDVDWYSSVDDCLMAGTETFPATLGATYKVEFDFVVSSGNDSDSFTQTVTREYTHD